MSPPSLAEQRDTRRSIRAEIAVLLRRVIEKFDFRGAGVPFDADAFLGSGRVEFGTLSPLQQDFIQRQLRHASVPLRAQTSVRLIPAWQILLGDYVRQPVPPVSEEWLERSGITQADWERRFQGQYVGRGVQNIVTIF